jgi:transcriptional regulator with XRE-family HTH domain
VSREKIGRSVQNGRMPDTEAEFLEAMLERTRALRLRRGFNKKQMAEALGVPYENYRQYEKRTPLPHYLIPRFAAIVQEEISVVLTGRKSSPLRSSAKPAEAPYQTQPAGRASDPPTPPDYLSN